MFGFTAGTDALLFLPRVWEAAGPKQQRGGPVGRSRRPAEGVVPDLGESSVPFVTSGGVFSVSFSDLELLLELNVPFQFIQFNAPV